MVKEVLKRHGVEQSRDLSCVLCNDETETIDHLFLHCKWSKRLWERAMSWWDVSCAANSSLLGWVEGWMGLCPNFKHERVWCSLFFATTWTIWEKRNAVIFNGAEASLEQSSDLVKFRVAWWFKHLGRGSEVSIEDLLRNIDMLCVESKKVQRKSIVDWIPPVHGHLKFNVDGSARGKPGPAGMGGVLRDYNGKILCLFSAYLGFLDSNVAEIWAIKRAVELCFSNPILRDQEIMVVSDSKVAVSWVNSVDFGNVDNVQTIFDIRSMLKERGGIKVVFDSRIFNSFADSLAKMGSSGRGDFVDWSDV